MFKVFVGNMNDDDVEAYVQRVANKFKREQIVDSKTGNVDMRFNQMAVDQDYFIPVRDPAQTNPIETLPGAQNLGEIADIEYIQKKLLAALRIPKAFLGFEEVVGDGKNLALMDIRFTRTINKIQKSLIQELNKVALIHLYLLGMEDELNNFQLSLTNPSTQSDLLKIETWKEKITLYKDATSDQSQMGILPVSHTWAKKNILGMSDSEVILDLQQQRLERAAAKELENTPEVIKNTGFFKKIDRLYGEIPTSSEEAGGTEETGGTEEAGGFGGGFGGGGGGARSGIGRAAGGGGAGGMLTGNIAVTTSSYTITVGGGGGSAIQSQGGTGTNSVFSTVTSKGGGGGGAYGSSGASGGSGGGAGGGETGAGNGSGTAGQGNNGGTDGGTVDGGGGGGSWSGVLSARNAQGELAYEMRMDIPRTKSSQVLILCSLVQTRELNYFLHSLKTLDT